MERLWRGLLLVAKELLLCHILERLLCPAPCQDGAGRLKSGLSTPMDNVVG